ncbi:MAG: hypothetical protein LAP87_29310, partial [Acidobacteriia bacterium]|nr:hypothetical protein [Terriglobia bacterium]
GFCVSNKIIGEVSGGVKCGFGERGGQGKKGIPKGKKPQVSFPLGYSNEMPRLALGCVWFGQSKLQIFLARFLFLLSL